MSKSAAGGGARLALTAADMADLRELRRLPGARFRRSFTAGED